MTNSKEEIEKELLKIIQASRKEGGTEETVNNHFLNAILFVLLDIRDLLIKE